jgi:class III poly(R)-hydroxyalkanoic acid synthase PhaE subunit
VREREQAGQPVGDFRALYDLWVECGEHVYAEVAHSDAYSRLQAELGNATMRLRSRQQAVIEQALKQFDLPTRTELNTVHLQLRELRAKLAAMEGAAPPDGTATRARSTSERSKKKPAKQRPKASSGRKRR